MSVSHGMSCSCCTTFPLTTGSTWAMLAQAPLPTPSCPGSGTGWGDPGLPGPAANLPGCLRKALQSSVSPSLKWWCPHPPQHSITEQGETHMGESGAQPSWREAAWSCHSWGSQRSSPQTWGSSSEGANSSGVQDKGQILLSAHTCTHTCT